MWCRVDIVLTDVSEERIASIFRVEEKRNPKANQREQVLTCSLSDFFIFFHLENGGDTFFFCPANMPTCRRSLSIALNRMMYVSSFG
jgi:hypothetical protein